MFMRLRTYLLFPQHVRESHISIDVMIVRTSISIAYSRYDDDIDRESDQSLVEASEHTSPDSPFATLMLKFRGKLTLVNCKGVATISSTTTTIYWYSHIKMVLPKIITNTRLITLN